jgi:cardiolipin synthase
MGREYVGLEERFGYWRDTHIRIRGAATLNLQLRFLLDWNYTAGKNLFGEPKYYMETAYGKHDFCKVQMIASGPDYSQEVIRDNYLYLIHKARKTIYIQTPYFIPDEAVFTALRMAVLSGVQVNIMIPCKPDHMFVYWATYSYVGELVMAGANCYTYDNGFLHAKGMIVDSEVFCYGTANLDIRSFALNFEVNAIVYDEEKAREMEGYFWEDLEYCSQISKDIYAKRSPGIRMKEQICRLLSPVL